MSMRPQHRNEVPVPTTLRAPVVSAAEAVIAPTSACPTCGRPAVKRSLGRTIFAIGMIAFGGVWLLNAGFGIGFEIPDNIPIIGNLDEGAATLLILAGLRYFGVELPFLRR